MSARSTAKPSSVAAPAAPIQFRDDFLSSSAALAASNEESVRSILSRLDMLQSKVVSADEIAPKATTTTTTAPRAAKLSTAPLDTNTSSLHARISQLESVHQDHLTRLGAQLSAVENQLIKNSGDNATMHEISAKFGQIESHIRNQGDSSERISRLESQLSSLQSRGSSSTELHARIRSLESEVSELRTATEPHPEQESLLRRINSRLDDIETKRGDSDYLGARSSESLKTAPAPRAAPSSSGVTAERQKYLAARIDKLKELRSRYE
jgi:predicted  nucleic acid-binding Zn-ribbon protein